MKVEELQGISQACKQQKACALNLDNCLLFFFFFYLWHFLHLYCFVFLKRFSFVDDEDSV